MTQRSDRIASIVRKEVGLGLQEMLPEYHCTITDTDVSADLRHALVHVSYLADTDLETVEQALLEVRPKLQRRVADQLRTKFTPRLRLRVDTGYEHSKRIDRLLHNL